MTEQGHIGYLNAAERVLEEAKEPLHYREITRRALENGWIVTAGKTPWATMYAQLGSSLSQKKESSPFLRVRPAVFGLRRWEGEGAERIHVDQTTGGAGRTFVPHYPIYEEVRAVLPAWEGAPRTAITTMRAAIMDLTGTPQSQVDWSEPDTWIDTRLAGEPRDWARRTWERSGKRVNPRHTTGHWALITHYQLLEVDVEGRLTLSERGKSFLDEEYGVLAQEIDESQGLLKILTTVAEASPASRADLFEPWREHLTAEGRVRADSVIKASLWARLRNLIHRGLVERTGRSYAVTQPGLDYLRRVGDGDAATPEEDPDQALRQLLGDQKQRVRESIRELLAEIDPYAFEHLIRQLLEEMGYEDVEVTAASGDKGVDVLGRIELGITSVLEVVQVKRQRGNIQRPVLDALRGSLHRFEAVRGTIITTGGFSKGTREAAFERGAAPITLIDGDKLVELLLENGIGVRKKKVELWELHVEAFAQAQDESE